MAGMLAAMPVLGRWPWVWLAPLAAYFVLVAVVPPLRRSFCWLRPGRLTLSACAVTLALASSTSAVLVGFQLIAKPDLGGYQEVLPLAILGGGVVAGATFALLNAVLEELVFRGVLFDALESQWGLCATVVLTAAAFGWGHLHGYPPGPAGACLAALYGVALGWLRAWTGGLAWPILAHIGADATIYGILTSGHL